MLTFLRLWNTLTGVRTFRGVAMLVAYYRVSTEKQGRSGLGLEAQRSAVQAFARSEGMEIAAEFTEVETG